MPDWVPLRGCGTYHTSRLAGGMVLVCTRAIALCKFQSASADVPEVKVSGYFLQAKGYRDDRYLI